MGERRWHEMSDGEQVGSYLQTTNERLDSIDLEITKMRQIAERWEESTVGNRMVRIQLTCAALAGLLACESETWHMSRNSEATKNERLAKSAVEYADACLAELEKPKQEKPE